MRTMGLALRRRERIKTATNINKENPNRRLNPGTPKLSVVINPRAAAAMSPMTASRKNRRTAAARNQRGFRDWYQAVILLKDDVERWG